MAEHFLDIPDVRAAFQHISGAGMTEPVARSKRRDAGLFHESGDPVAEIGGTEARAVAAEEERGFGWEVGEERPDLGEVTPQPPRGMSTRKMRSREARPDLRLVQTVTTQEGGKEKIIAVTGDFGGAKIDQVRLKDGESLDLSQPAGKQLRAHGPFTTEGMADQLV